MAEDRELLTQFLKDGSRSALSTLVERYRKMVYAVCLRELGDPDDAADATQATFVLLQSSASRIKRREKLGCTPPRATCAETRGESAFSAARSRAPRLTKMLPTLPILPLLSPRETR